MTNDTASLLLDMAAAGLSKTTSRMLHSAAGALTVLAVVLGAGCPVVDDRAGPEFAGYEPAELMLEGF